MADHVPGTMHRRLWFVLPALMTSLLHAQPQLQPQPKTDSGAILPNSLGDYRSATRSAVAMGPAMGALLNEYGLRTTDRVVYASSTERRMTAEAFRFQSSEGGLAAYLCLRPAGAVESPLAGYCDVAGVFGQTHAVLAGGMTVVGRSNYVFRFSGGAPANSELRAMLDRLPGLDGTAPPKGECCAYFVPSSERYLLGPVSLKRFAPKVPVEVAAISSGSRGRVARFETPAGPMMKVVFEYRSPAAAREHAAGFQALRGTRVRIGGSRIGAIFDAVDAEEADALLKDIDSEGGDTVGWDSKFIWDGPLSLEQSMGSTFVAFGLGGLIAMVRFLVNRREGIPDRTISLHIAQGLG
jgi:hypothetical protein